MSELPQARLVGKRTTLSIPAAFVIVWLGYRILLGTRGDDVFGAYHNDVFWPADTYLTSAQPGFVLQLFGHVMVTLVGGLFLLVLIAGLLRLFKRGAWAPKLTPFVFWALFVYAFLFLRAIPRQVTVVDREAHELRLRDFAGFTFFPVDSRVIAGSEIRAFGARVENYTSRRSSDDVIRLYALVGETRERVLLGLRECPGAKSECLEVADAAITALATDLGREVTTRETNADKTVRAFALR